MLFPLMANPLRCNSLSNQCTSRSHRPTKFLRLGRRCLLNMGILMRLIIRRQFRIRHSQLQECHIIKKLQRPRVIMHKLVSVKWLLTMLNTLPRQSRRHTRLQHRCLSRLRRRFPKKLAPIHLLNSPRFHPRHRTTTILLIKTKRHRSRLKPRSLHNTPARLLTSSTTTHLRRMGVLQTQLQFQVALGRYHRQR